MPQPIQATSNRFFGKYRGIVAANNDTQALGRIQATLPAFQGMLTNWALPCVPYAGLNVGFFAMPPIGASVWIEFEGGNPNYPVWSGCFWEVNDIPSDLQSLNSQNMSQVKFLKTETITLILNDTDQNQGGVTLKVVSPALQTPITVTMDNNGVKVLCGVSTALLDPNNGITLTVQQGPNDANPTQVMLQLQSIQATSNAVTGTAQEGLTLNGGTVDIESKGDATVKAAGQITASGGTQATFQGGTSATLTAGGAITVDAGPGEVTVNGSAVTISPEGDVTIDTAGAVNITAGLEAGMSAGLDLSLSAGGAAELNAAGDVNVGALGAVEIEAVGDISYTAITHAMTGIVEVTGGLFEDSMPVLVAPF
jgi:Type VI secretion system/phage-baseplate injector OB domain